MATVFHSSNLYSKCQYAGILYPRHAINALLVAINDTSGEKRLDAMTKRFLLANWDSVTAYANAVFAAVASLECVDVVMMRLECDLFMDKTEDSITIYFNRTTPLPGENCRADEDCYDNFDASSFYGSKVEVISRPTNGFDDEQKAVVRNLLASLGYVRSGSRDEAVNRLAQSVQARHPEETIIARLAYLLLKAAIFNGDVEQINNFHKPMYRLADRVS